MKNKKILLLTLLMTSCSSVTYTNSIIVNHNNTLVSSNEANNTINTKLLKVNQSVSEDLEAFDIDFSKYYVDKKMVVEPILISFTESLKSNSMDLYYFYDPNNQFTYSSIEYSVNYSNNENIIDDIKNGNYSYSTIETPYNKNLYFTGVSEDGYVKRFSSFISEEELSQRLSYEYHYYNIKGINSDEYILGNQYLFNKNSLEYSNDLTIRLLDPHCWSWHFDEDYSWDNFCDWITGKDTLKDQLFYSFYVDGWDISDIKSIDLMYKKVLLQGYRYNESDTGNKSEYYKNQLDYKYGPKYYAWNENNSKDNYDTSNYLGSSIEEITNKVDYTYTTIKHKKNNSSGVDHNYEWDLIQNKASFKSSFGEDSDIYKFANNYFNESDQEYWIINFDDFYYSYNQFKLYGGTYNDMNNLYTSYIFFCTNNPDEEDIEYCNYLLNHKADYYKNATYMNMNMLYFKAYSFSQEYVFNMKATQMTFTDSNETTRTLPVSVTPISEEASGGTSEDFTLEQVVDSLFEKIKKWISSLFSNFWDIFKWILFALLGIIGIKTIINILRGEIK